MMAGMGPGMMGAGACQLVQGRISPMGYCDLYVPWARGLIVGVPQGPASAEEDVFH
jgi:hypothetical protein